MNIPKLEELGISPAPWKYIGYHCHKPGEYIHLGEVKFADGRKLCHDISQPNGRLIAAAPELYKALCEALPWLTDIGAELVGNESAREIAAVVAKAEAALRKASGMEELSNDLS